MESLAARTDRMNREESTDDATPTGDAETDAETDATSEDGADASTEATAQRRSPWTLRGWRIALLVMVVVVASLAVLAYREDEKRSERQDLDTDSRAAVAVATELAQSLASVTPETISDDMSHIRALSTGTFAEQLDGSLGGQIQSVRKSRISSVGTVDQVGVVDADGRTADVLVALSSDVVSDSVSEPEQRLYRLKIHLERSGSTWLVSELEFVE